MPKTPWIESLLITGLWVGVSGWLHDPLTLHSPFPWIWFAPVLIALRYGLWPSQLSCLLILGSYDYQIRPSEISLELGLFILGGFLLTLLCAMAQSTAQKKIKESEAISTYLQTRVSTIANAYKVVVLAYQRIEQNYIIKPVTIRTALMNLRELPARSQNEQPVLDRVLNILAVQCGIEVGGIFPVHHQQLITQPIASIGCMSTPDPKDYMIKECIENGGITYIKAKDLTHRHRSKWLIVAPLMKPDRTIYALLLVESISFLQLSDETIETIHVLLQYYLEGQPLKDAYQIIHEYPCCPVDFANELQRLMTLFQATQQDSAIVAFTVFESPEQQDYVFRLQQEKRGLDSLWEKKDGQQTRLLILMPLTKQAALEGFRLRINNLLENDYQTHLNEGSIRYLSYQLSSFEQPLDLLQAILQAS